VFALLYDRGDSSTMMMPKIWYRRNTAIGVEIVNRVIRAHARWDWHPATSKERSALIVRNPIQSAWAKSHQCTLERQCWLVGEGLNQAERSARAHQKGCLCLNVMGCESDVCPLERVRLQEWAL
jgi:hypothetical protein